MIPKLLSEQDSPIAEYDYFQRMKLVNQLKELPDEVFTRLQYLQPQIGCFNRCAFCSQSAGKDIWQFTERGLKNFFAAFSFVAREKSKNDGLLIGATRSHRPGVIFPYMDNDVASYPHLYQYIKYSWEDLGAKVRIATVGYSSANSSLQQMHESIVSDFSQVIAGIRFSYTPYTIGWTGGDKTSRSQFVKDFANALRTYMPLISKIGMGKETACVELRFKPLLVTFDKQIDDEVINNHHVICIGPHLLIRRQEGDEKILLNQVNDVANGIPIFAHLPTDYTLLTSDTAIEHGDWRKVARSYINTAHVPSKTNLRIVKLYKMKNFDGEYYTVDPVFQSDGSFRALNVYPQTLKRPVSGYVDSTRFFLNALLYQKKLSGIGRREDFNQATDADVQGVIDILKSATIVYRNYDQRASSHIDSAILPLVTLYATVLYEAGYPANIFFDRKFTIDTGQIVNQGRARVLFHQLVSRNDEPMTVGEERGYGAASISTQRGNIWRIAPMAYGLLGQEANRARTGQKNSLSEKMSIQIQELDPRHLLPVDRATSQPLREYYIEGVELEHISLDQANDKLMYPGL